MTKDFVDDLIEVVDVKKTVKKSSKTNLAPSKGRTFEIAGIEVKNKRIFTEEHKQKIAEANKGRVVSEEHKRKLSEAKKGVKLSEETRKRMSEGKKGKVIPEEVVRKIVETRKRNGYTHSEETRLKISEGNKGKVGTNKGKILVLTDEQRKVRSESQKGRVTSEATKQKLREILTGRKLSTEMKAYVIEKRRQPVMTPNGEFKSRQELVDRLVADGVSNPSDKLRAWFKIYPNDFFYIRKNKVSSEKNINFKVDPFSTLNETAMKLLTIIFSCHKEGKPLTVLNAMSLKYVASEITIHRRLAHMLELGLIVKQFKGNDFRRKYLLPTKPSIDYLESNASIQKLVRTHSKSSDITDVTKRT